MEETKEAFIKRFEEQVIDKSNVQPSDQVHMEAASIWETYCNVKKNSPYQEEHLVDSPSFQMFCAHLPEIVLKGIISKSDAGDEDPKKSAHVDITKAVEDRQLVFGWANVAIMQNGEFPLDWDRDQTLPEELEKAAYGYVLENEGTDEIHAGPPVGYLVESVMFTKEKMASMGIPEGAVPEAWWVGFWIPDKEIFQKVKDGEYKMFSVGGEGYRAPIDKD